MHHPKPCSAAAFGIRRDRGQPRAVEIRQLLCFFPPSLLSLSWYPNARRSRTRYGNSIHTIRARRVRRFRPSSGVRRAPHGRPGTARAVTQASLRREEHYLHICQAPPLAASNSQFYGHLPSTVHRHRPPSSVLSNCHGIEAGQHTRTRRRPRSPPLVREPLPQASCACSYWLPARHPPGQPNSKGRAPATAQPPGGHHTCTCIAPAAAPRFLRACPASARVFPG